MATKTEHSGAKKGGSGYHGHHSVAKLICRRQRRTQDRRLEHLAKRNPELIEQ